MLALHNFAESEESAHAVSGVDHEVAGLEVGQVRRENAELALGDAWTRNQVGRIEQVLRADERDGGFGEDRAPSNQSLY